jgi:hypothetical protein
MKKNKTVLHIVSYSNCGLTAPKARSKSKCITNRTYKETVKIDKHIINHFGTTKGINPYRVNRMITSQYSHGYVELKELAGWLGYKNLRQLRKMIKNDWKQFLCVRTSKTGVERVFATSQDKLSKICRGDKVVRTYYYLPVKSLKKANLFKKTLTEAICSDNRVCNYGKAATLLGVHRNTISTRLAHTKRKPAFKQITPYSDKSTAVSQYDVINKVMEEPGILRVIRVRGTYCVASRAGSQVKRPKWFSRRIIKEQK